MRQMARSLLGGIRRHPWRTLVALLLVGFVGLNVVAYQHARKMLTFQPDAAERTASPRKLSVGEKLRVLATGVSLPRPTITRTPESVGLDYETFQARSASGVSLAGWVIRPPNPRGTVMLFHGYASSRSSLLNEAREFYGLGYVAVLVDFRGCGGSDGNQTSLGYYEAEDVATTVDYVRDRGLPGPVVLYGQSMGGAAVLRSISADQVRVDAVILESAFGRMRDAVCNRFAMMGVPSFPSADLLVFWGSVQVGFSGFKHNPCEYARDCDCAALVLHGADDLHATVQEADAIYQNLRGKKELVVFADAGHAPLLAAPSSPWKAVIGEFLAKQTEAQQ